VKLSSPEPLDVAWVKNYLGLFKYSLIFSRFDSTGSGSDLRQPWFYRAKLALKPKRGGARDQFRTNGGWYGFSGSTSVRDLIFGGGYTIITPPPPASISFRIPWLANTSCMPVCGQRFALFWPIVESYIAGFYIRALWQAAVTISVSNFSTASELYTDFKSPGRCL